MLHCTALHFSIPPRDQFFVPCFWGATHHTAGEIYDLDLFASPEYSSFLLQKVSEKGQ